VITDVDGKTYLDLLGGIAVNILGHRHPAIIEAVTAQLNTLGHVSNLYATEPGIALAEALVGHLGTHARVFFCNSGAEANEVAFKITRLTGRTKIVAAQNAFHGRTMGSLALTGKPAAREPFEPLLGDVTHVPFGDADALSVGDYNVSKMIGWTLLGRPIDDAEMVELLEPMRPHRYRAVRLLEVSGLARERTAADARALRARRRARHGWRGRAPRRSAPA
jgi:hypothetical protein